MSGIKLAVVKSTKGGYFMSKGIQSLIGRRRVITITPKASAADAAKMMRESHVGDLVVAQTDGNRLTDRKSTRLNSSH